MNFPDRETVERVRKEYPAGTRVILEKMEDKQAPPVGSLGTVIGVDDTASLLMKWDNGRTLGIVPGEDQFRVIPESQEEVMENDQKQTMGGMGM